MPGTNISRVKFMLIIFSSLVPSLILHNFMPPDPFASAAGTAPRAFARQELLPLIGLTGMFVQHLILGLLFLTVQRHIAGTRMSKGLLYAAAIVGVWIVGVAEVQVLFSVPFWDELLFQAPIMLGTVLMCILLGRYVGEDTRHDGPPAYKAFPAIVAIPILYVVVRYFLYLVPRLHSSHAERPLATLLWTAGMGLLLALLYGILGVRIMHPSPLKHAALFGVCIFGVNWLMYNLYPLLLFEAPAWDLFSRSVADTAAVVAGVYAPGALQRRHDTGG